MFLDDAVTQAQTESRAFADRLGREKKIENSSKVLGPDAGTVVLKCDREQLAAVPRANHDLSLAPHRLNRLPRVADDVDEYLLQLVDIERVHGSSGQEIKSRTSEKLCNSPSARN